MVSKNNEEQVEAKMKTEGKKRKKTQNQKRRRKGGRKERMRRSLVQNYLK